MRQYLNELKKKNNNEFENYDIFHAWFYVVVLIVLLRFNRFRVYFSQ